MGMKLTYNLHSFYVFSTCDSFAQKHNYQTYNCKIIAGISRQEGEGVGGGVGPLNVKQRSDLISPLYTITPHVELMRLA